ncbi:hypothetical protein PENSPDRAFT_707438 [Peniophora sp. CONT]|nr:hypothetical protein PENSPDRAFT_707438 [Peniophora sp. CONT]
MALYAQLLSFLGRLHALYDEIRHRQRRHPFGNIKVAELARRAESVHVARKQISLNSLTAGPTVWSLQDWTRYHCYALSQAYKSVDELFEAEAFCESLVPFIELPVNNDTQAGAQSFELCKFVIRELKVFDLIARLIKSCSLLDTSQVVLTDAASSRRMIVAMSLARALLRWCLPPEMLLHRPTPRRLQVEESAASSELGEIISELLKSGLHECLRISPLVQLHSHRTSTIFSCFLAAIRADLFAVAIQEESLRGPSYPRWNVTELYEGPMVASLHSWLHEIDYFDSTSRTSTYACHTLLDNFLWVYDWIADVGAQSEGLTVLNAMQSTWAPLVTHAYKAALSYLCLMPIGENPDSLQTHPSVLDLRALVRKLGLHRDSAATMKDGWLSKKADYARTDVYPGYVRLFREHAYLTEWLSTLCSRVHDQVKQQPQADLPVDEKPKLPRVGLHLVSQAVEQSQNGGIIAPESKTTGGSSAAVPDSRVNSSLRSDPAKSLMAAHRSSTDRRGHGYEAAITPYPYHLERPHESSTTRTAKGLKPSPEEQESEYQLPVTMQARAGPSKLGNALKTARGYLATKPHGKRKLSGPIDIDEDEDDMSSSQRIKGVGDSYEDVSVILRYYGK